MVQDVRPGFWRQSSSREPFDRAVAGIDRLELPKRPGAKRLCIGYPLESKRFLCPRRRPTNCTRCSRTFVVFQGIFALHSVVATVARV